MVCNDFFKTILVIISSFYFFLGGGLVLGSSSSEVFQKEVPVKASDEHFSKRKLELISVKGFRGSFQHQGCNDVPCEGF